MSYLWNWAESRTQLLFTYLKENEVRSQAIKAFLNTLIIVVPMLFTIWVNLLSDWGNVAKVGLLIGYTFVAILYAGWELIINVNIIQKRETAVRDEAFREVRDIQTLVDSMRQLTPNPSQFRVGLFIYNKFTDTLNLRYYSGDYSIAERKIVFKRREGLVGYVLANYAIYDDSTWFYADLSNITDAELLETWHMNQAQIDATHQLTLILAVPVVDNNKHLLGVLAIDTADASGKYTADALLQFDDTEQADGDFAEAIATAAIVCARLLHV